LVGLACLIGHNDREGTKTMVRLPHPGSGVGIYLSRMNFGAALAEFECEVIGQAPSVQHHERSDRLLELTKFARGIEIDDVSNLVLDRLIGKVPSELCNAIYNGLGEIADNVRYHAECEFGWFAAQTYEVGTPQERIEVAIGDSGIGIRTALARGEVADTRPYDDLSAIYYALKMGSAASTILVAVKGFQQRQTR
jgi:hypothetical protein